MGIGIGGALVLVGIGVVAGVGVAAAVYVPRIEELEDENSLLAQRIDAQGIEIEMLNGHNISLRNYISYQDGQIKALEGDYNDLSNKYDRIIGELENFQVQIPDQEAKKLLAQLIERAKQRKTQRATPVRAFN